MALLHTQRHHARKSYELVYDDPSQLKYYDSGVGTDGAPFEHFLAESMGAGLFKGSRMGMSSFCALSLVADAS